MAIETAYFSADNKRQNSECVIFVEGVDDAYFLSKLLAEIGADPSKNGIVEVGGKTNFSSRLRAFLKSSNFTRGVIKRLIIVCDADANATAAHGSIRDTLQNAGQPAIEQNSFATNETGITIGIFAMPNGQDAGDLESLCLDTVAGTELAAAADSYMQAAVDIAQSKRKVMTGSLTKRKAQIYLAGFPDDLCRGAGRGYSIGAFDNSHVALAPLKAFLTSGIA